MSSTIAPNNKSPIQDEEYIVYHGSLTRDITSFNPGSHFGTFEQALVCIAAHAFIDDEFPILPTMYKCRIKLKKDNIHRIADWGSPNIQAALLAYLNQMAVIAQKNKRKYLAIIQRFRKTPEALALKFLNKEMLKRKHKALSQLNKLVFIEYDPTSKKSNILLTIDWTNPDPQTALTAYLDHVSKNDQKKKSNYHRKLQESGSNSESNALNFLHTEIALRGHRAFSYDNKIESSGDSLMTLYSEDVEILESWEPCRKQIFDVFSENIQRIQPFNLESAMRKAQQFKDGII
ncbi:hypothetical protein [Pseudomonas proteolytica]|uniref:hypothetical protein n=1 Tax=Pseudomonas proteolytica TaxID=219574 RepID=UPI001475425F|nr:hypothetical protein [Pseudomonas proteolytica]NMZ34002.1 hypothetical protein [Pseudomonas proteolytica]